MRCIKHAADALRRRSSLRVEYTGLPQAAEASQPNIAERWCDRATAIHSWSTLRTSHFRLFELRSPRSSLSGLTLSSASSLPFHLHRSASTVIQFPLAQTGEGIKECELTEWFVEV